EGALSSKNPAVSREIEFRDMLFKIAEEIGEDDLKSLKEHSGVLEFIPKGTLEKMKTASDVFESLREKNVISYHNTENLEELLKHIRRNDLVERFVSK
ncbi:caspase-8-like, partial [Saccoglossus kowalevskii]